jgi:hypothetical protein
MLAPPGVVLMVEDTVAAALKYKNEWIASTTQQHT